jgi:hypothetical protein
MHVKLIEQYERTANQRVRLTLLSVAGKVYGVRCTADLQNALWQPSPFATSDTGPLGESPVEGTGGWLSFYVPIGGPGWFFRVEAR